MIPHLQTEATHPPKNTLLNNSARKVQTDKIWTFTKVNSMSSLKWFNPQFVLVLWLRSKRKKPNHLHSSANCQKQKYFNSLWPNEKEGGDTGTNQGRSRRTLHDTACRVCKLNEGNVCLVWSLWPVRHSGSRHRFFSFTRTIRSLRHAEVQRDFLLRLR